MMDRRMVSILLPSRGRPDNVRRLQQSLMDTTDGEWELLVRLDSDDDFTRYETLPGTVHVTAPRGVLAQAWNDLIPYALGDIFMLCGDDVTFETPGWDRRVREAFPDDGIAVIHCNDLSPNSATIGTHPFVTRRWVETVGAFLPPYFASDYSDLWLTEVADAVGRRFYLPDVVTEHHHPAFGKADWDQTHQDRIERHKSENVDQIWKDTAPIRSQWVELLRAKIQG